ncbi:MAG: replication initiation protein [Arcobacteraceae bacterium]
MNEFGKPLKKEQLKFLYKDTLISGSELRRDHSLVEHIGGKIERKKTGVMQQRIAREIFTEIQQRTISTFKRKDIENQMKQIVLEDIKSKDIKNVTKEIYDVAVAQRVNEYIKKNIDNEFMFSDKEIQEITQSSSNNVAYVKNKVLPSMRSNNSHIVYENYVTDDYSEIRTKRLDISYFPTFGDDYSQKDPNGERKIIVRLNQDLLPYIVSPNKNSYSSYITLHSEVMNTFDSTYTECIYEIVMQYKAIWRNKRFTYKELRERFGTMHGIKKKLNPDYDPETMTSSQKYLKNINNQPMYEVDKKSNFVYEDNYKSTYRTFKRDVLNVAIGEMNSKTDYDITIIEHRTNNAANGAIEYIQFEVQDNHPVRFMKFLSILVFHKYNENNLSLKEITKELKNEDSRFELLEELNITEDILENDLIKNNTSYKTIKTLLKEEESISKNYIFDEEYLVVKDIKTKERMGDTPAECLHYLKTTYPKLFIDDDFIKNANCEIKDFLPFEVTHKEKSYMVYNKNYKEHEEKINIEIEANNKRAFKKFKSKYIKQEFISFLENHHNDKK